MADTPSTDDELLKLAAERLRSGDGLSAIDPNDIANFLTDTAEGLPPSGGVDSSEQETALRIAHAVLDQPERAAYERLRSDASPLPKYTSNALVWLLGAIPGEDVDPHGWAPGAWEELRRRVAREILALPAPAPAVDRERLSGAHGTDASLLLRAAEHARQALPRPLGRHLAGVLEMEHHWYPHDDGSGDWLAYAALARAVLALPVPAPVPAQDAVTDFPGASDDDAAVSLAHGRQWIAHQGQSFLPSWDELTEREREQAITEARHWLMAAVNVGLLPPAREFECPSCRGVIRARAVPAPASAAVTEHAIEMSDGHMRVYIQRQVSMPHMEPERVDAIQWTGRNFAELAATFPEVNARIVGEGDGRLVASVADGELGFKVGWWLIRTHSGYLCAMFPWAFEQRYRLDVSEEAPRG